MLLWYHITDDKNTYHKNPLYFACPRPFTSFQLKCHLLLKPAGEFKCYFTALKNILYCIIRLPFVAFEYKVVFEKMKFTFKLCSSLCERKKPSFWARRFKKNLCFVHDNFKIRQITFLSVHLTSLLKTWRHKKDSYKM